MPGAEAIERWRLDALNLASSAFAGLALSWSAIFFATNLYGTRLSTIVMVAMFVVPAIRPLGFRIRSAALLGALLLTPLIGGATGGPTVGAVTGGLMSVVAAATWFGPRWAIAAWLTSTVMLATGFVLATHNPAYSPALLDLRVGTNMFRVLFTYAGMSSILLGGLVVVVRRLNESLHEARTLAMAERQARLEAESANERREQTLRQVVEAQRYEVMGQLAGSMAHDINNALQFIMLQAELMARGTVNQMQVRALGSEVLDVCHQSSTLARQLLTLGQRTILDREVVDVGAELNKMESGIRRTLPTNVTFRVDAALGLRAYLDKSQLKQALLNLTINACHAMPDGGELAYWARARDGWIDVEVRDTGLGMDSEMLAKVFEPFFTTKGAAGTGLGLPAVKAIVEQHGGQVLVTSKPAKGTAFRMTFPVYVGDEAAREDAAASEVSLQGCRVLLVEDDPRVRRSMQQILSAAGARVVQAARGEAAIAAAKPGDIDVLCTDAIMPGMPARDLIDRFRAERPELPVVVCSACVESDLLRRGIETKSIAFLAKPFSANQLIEKIATSRRSAT